MDKEIFDYLDLQKKGVGNEIQLTDGIDFILKKSSVLGYRFSGKRFDCGNKLGYIYANLEFGMSDKKIKKEILNYIKSL